MVRQAIKLAAPQGSDLGASAALLEGDANPVVAVDDANVTAVIAD